MHFFKKQMEYNELFARNELLVGSDSMRNIASKKVILFGVGGAKNLAGESSC